MRRRSDCHIYIIRILGQLAVPLSRPGFWHRQLRHCPLQRTAQHVRWRAVRCCTAGRAPGAKLLALDNDLCERFGSIPVAVLVTLYGTTGPIDKKARALETTVSRLHQLRRAARKITLSHIATDTSAEDFHRARYRIRSKQSEHTARPLQPVPAADKNGQ